MKTRFFIPFAMALIVFSWIFVSTAVIVNVTPSMPEGLYLKVPFTGSVNIGDIVTFNSPMPDGSMGLVLNETPLMKHVVAISDDGEKILVRGDSDLSFDSRYFGAIDMSAIKAKAYPLLTR